MEELKKINLNSLDKASETIPSEKKDSSRLGKRIAIPVILILAVTLITLFAVVLPVKKVYSSAMKTYKQVQRAWDAVKKQNIALASEELDKTKKDLLATQKDFKNLSFLRLIPIASNYYNDAEHLLSAGSYGIDSASTVIESIRPYSDVLGLKGQGSFVMGSAEQRIQLAIMTMGKVTPKIDDVAKSLTLAKKEIDAVDPNHYPSFFGGEKIKNQLLKIKTIADQGVTSVNEARPLIKVLPSLLGESKEKKYLVLFQNDKELRATGGFITAYSVFRIDKGIIHVDKSDDIYNLDNSIPSKKRAPEAVLKYLPKVTTLNLRDSNISPDFIESMKTFEGMYNQASQKTNVDGIIAIDTSILVSTIKILDDEVFAAGIRFTSKTDKRCNCPQVIYELEDNISRPVNYQKSGRKDLLGALLYAIMEKALKSSPKLYWGPLFQDTLAKVNEKHILFYLYDKEAQSGIEALNAAGRIRSFEGDYLHINDTNFAGAKSNMYVSESVEQNYEVKSDKSIIKTIAIRYKNPFPPSDCNLERGGLCLNAPLRNWLRIYVPKGSILVDSQGSEVKVMSYEELGKTVFEGFLTVRPEGTAAFTITYKLPFKLDGSSLPVLIQKQGGTYNNDYKIKINGKEKEKFELLLDKELRLKI